VGAVTRLLDRSELGASIARRLVANTAVARSVPRTAMHVAIQEDHGYTIEVTR
jgi:hypothetical protein